MEQAAGNSRQASEGQSTTDEGRSQAIENRQSSIENCSVCRFWKRNDPTERQKKKFNITKSSRGICRFNPPKAEYHPSRITAIGVSESYTDTIWPDTMETDWCGKFEKQALDQSPQSSVRFIFVNGKKYTVKHNEMSAQAIKYLAGIHRLDILSLDIGDGAFKELRDDELVSVECEESFVSQRQAVQEIEN